MKTQEDFNPKNDSRTHNLLESYDSAANNHSAWSLSYALQAHLPDDFKKVEFYEAWTPFRQVTYVGTTREEAIAAMLFGIAELARNGSFNPNDPTAKGSPPIQHVLDILQERLTWHLARRKEAIESYHDAEGTPVHESAPAVFLGEAGKHNEAIISLGTAIAALARVKDL